MGLLDTVADVTSGIADVAPIPGSDLVAGGIDAAQDALGGGGGGGGRQQLPATTQDPGAPSPPSGPGFSTGGQMNIPGLPPMGGGMDFGFGQGQGQQDDGQQGGQQGGQMMQGGGFGPSMMMEILEDSVSSESGRAVLEAMTSGSLQAGPIQRPAQVETPRGTRNVSPPGFRTVYVNDQPFAVFKPLAKALGLINDSNSTMRSKMDKTTREYMKYRRQIEDLAGKVGLKTENRKSGPKR